MKNIRKEEFYTMLFYGLMKTTKAHPEKIALIFGRERLSYAQLSGQVETFMDRLRLFSVNEGDCIALVMPNSIEFVMSFYAIAGLRAIALLLNPALKVDEFKYYLGDNNIRVIVTDAERAAVCRQAAHELGRDISIVIADERDHVAPASRWPTDEDLDSSQALFEGPVICQYSSGTTDQAKKVCRTQKNLGYEIEAFVKGVHMTAADTILCVVPLFHALGFGKCMLASIATGATLVILEQSVREGVAIESPFVFRSQRVFELIEQEQVSLLPGSPYIFGVLAETPEDVQVDVSSLRLCMTGGNILPEETFNCFKRRFGIPLRSLYGSTETGPIALNMESDEDVRFDSAGRPCENVEVRITDETLEEFPVGSIGEVAVRSPSMTTGYLNMPELNREKFKDGFFFIGDLGRKDEQGRLYITGRKKIFIDNGGEKVDPWEVEQVLLTHPVVDEAAVVGIPGPYGGEAIKAVIVAHSSLTELDILLYCKDRLSDYKLPRIVEFRQELPRNALGKLVRKDLINGQSFATRSVATQKDSLLRSWIISALIAGKEAPEQLLSIRICEQVAAFLHRDASEIDAQRPLGEFGLGSLMAVELRDWLEISLELTIPVTLFWSYPTASAIAAHLVAMLRLSVPTEQSTAILALPTREMVEKQPALYEIEHLSDAEVQRQIDSMTTQIWENEAMHGTDDLSSYLTQVERMLDPEVQESLSQEILKGKNNIHE